MSNNRTLTNITNPGYFLISINKLSSSPYGEEKDNRDDEDNQDTIDQLIFQELT